MSAGSSAPSSGLLARMTRAAGRMTGLRPGDAIELAVDTSYVHFFDPDSGLAIGRTVPAADG